MKTIFQAGFRPLLAAGLALLLAGCVGADTRPIADGTARAVVGSSELPTPDSTVDGRYIGKSDYRVGALDLLEISVFQVPDLNRSVRVNSSGQISLPLIGAIDAGGKTVQELELEIAERLMDGYLQAPQVTVFVQEFTSQRITVEGAVNQPGIYPITGETSLLQAIALARGLDRVANRQGIIVFRTIGGQRMAAVFDINEIRAGQADDPQLYGDDIIVVDESGRRTAWRDFLQSIPAVGLFMAL